MTSRIGWTIGGVLVVTAVAGTWLVSARPGADETRFAETRGGDPMPRESKTRDEFAADRAPKLGEGKSIDSERCLQYLKELCDLGPRVSGSVGMTKQQTLLIKHFEALGGKTEKQEFQIRQRSRRDATAMTNLIFSWFPDRKKRIILCTHYDTRPAAHEELQREAWSKPFISANDGTSGVALLMELAHQMKDFPTGVGIDFVLFDGEEYIFEPGPMYNPGAESDKYFFGSEHFAEVYSKRKAGSFTYEAAVLLDLCAHDGARLAIEGYSWRNAQELTLEIWKTAEKIGAKSFQMERGFTRGDDVLDDHVALQKVGIPAVDVIDFDYKHWHMLSDTPDKCSGKQFAEVGNTLTTWLRKR